jgi:hypothetical protein
VQKKSPAEAGLRFSHLSRQSLARSRRRVELREPPNILGDRIETAQKTSLGVVAAKFPHAPQLALKVGGTSDTLGRYSGIECGPSVPPTYGSGSDPLKYLDVRVFR